MTTTVANNYPGGTLHCSRPPSHLQHSALQASKPPAALCAAHLQATGARRVTGRPALQHQQAAAARVCRIPAPNRALGCGAAVACTHPSCIAASTMGGANSFHHKLPAPITASPAASSPHAPMQLTARRLLWLQRRAASARPLGVAPAKPGPPATRICALPFLPACCLPCLWHATGRSRAASTATLSMLLPAHVRVCASLTALKSAAVG